MSLVVQVIVVAVYGGSAIIAAGSGLAWMISHRFRESMIGDQALR